MKHMRNNKCAKQITPEFVRSPLSAAIKSALLLSTMMGGIVSAQQLPVEAAGDSRFNIQSISTEASRVTVTQNEQVAWVKWDTYNIGEGNTVAYNFTEGGNAFHALNFVMGTQISDIQGSITSDGNVYLFNGNGIVFSNSAMINVAGLVASAQSPSVQGIDSIAEQLADGTTSVNLEVALSGLAGDGAIEINDSASLTSTLNDITLLGQTISAADNNGDAVNNTSTVSSQGSINVYANNRSTVTLDLNSDVFSVEVNEALAGDPGESLVDLQNSQMIARVGVNISAQSAQALTMNAINTTGIVQADSVSIDADGNVVLGNVSAASSLDVNASSGDVTDAGTIDAAVASFTLQDASEANILLDTADNNIGAFSASGENLNDVTLVDTFGVILNGVEADSLNLTTSGDVAQSDVLAVDDVFITAAQAGSRFNIRLDGVYDNGTGFNQIDRFGAIGRDIQLVESGGIALTGVAAGNNLVVSTDGDITQSGELNVLNSTSMYALSGDGQAFSVVLENSSNELGTFKGMGTDISVTDAQGMQLGDVEAMTSLTVTALSGDINGEGQVLAPLATFNALDNTATRIILTHQNNNLGALATSGEHIREIFLEDTAGLILSGVNADLFTLTTSGAVTQTDVVRLGDAQINAVEGDTTFNIELNLVTEEGTTFNDIGALGGVGNNILLIEANGVMLDGLTATQDLLVSTDGDITQRGTINVGGNTQIAALSDKSEGFNVTLEHADNNLGVFSSVGNSISVVGADGVILGVVEAAESFTVTALSGDITDSGSVSAPEATFAASPTGDVVIDSQDNTIGVFSASGSTVSVLGTDGLVLGNILADNALNVAVLSGDVTDVGTVKAGQATFEMLDATEANIVLDSNGNDLVAFRTLGDNINTVTLVDNFGMILNGVEAGTLTLTTSGDVAQSDVLDVEDVFISAAQGSARFNIRLDGVFDNGSTFNQVNTFGAIGRDIQLVESGGIALTGVAAGNNLAVSTDGAITQTGELNVLNSTSMFALSGDGQAFDIVLQHGANELGGFSGVGTNISVTDAQGLELGDVEVANVLTATALSGGITGEGRVLAPLATFNALDNTSADIVLTNQDNNIGALATSGEHIREIFLKDTGGLILNGVNADLFTLTTSGAVTQTDVVRLGDAQINAVEGDTTFNIELNLVTENGTTFNEVGALGGVGNNVLLIDANGVMLNGLTATQDLLVSTDGDITQGGAVKVSGNTLIAALSENGVGFNIALENAENDFGLFNTVGNQISVVDADGVLLGNVEASQSFAVAAVSGNITDSGFVSAPEATFSASPTGDVVIDSMDNTIGVFSASGSTVKVLGLDGLVLGDIQAETALNAVVLSGDVTDVGTVQAANATFNMLDTSGVSIVLDSTDNNIGSFTALGENFNTITVTDVGGMIVADLSANTVALSSGGNLNTGTIVADAVVMSAEGNTTAGDITAQTINIDATGEAALGNLNAQSVAIIAGADAASGNVNSDTLALTSGGDMTSGNIAADSVTISAGGAMNLGSIASDNLRLTAGGDVTQQAGTAITTDTLQLNLTESATVSLGSADNTADSLDINAESDLVIAQLTLADDGGVTGAVSIDAQGDVYVNAINAQTANVTLTSDGSVMSVNSDALASVSRAADAGAGSPRNVPGDGYISGHNVAVKVAQSMDLGTIVAANNVELIAFGQHGPQNRVGMPVTINIENPIQAGGVIGVAVAPDASANVTSSDDNLATVYVRDDFSDTVTLGLVDGAPSSGNFVAVSGGTSDERSSALEGYAASQHSLSLPAQRELQPQEQTGTFDVSGASVKLPDNHIRVTPSASGVGGAR